ncbi:hypothetical protein [Nocardiopsis sp. NRRL B-16309]|uniref:hypothetical protein n=1 Tax=Nocardiopsis sp. NRRL B-16309 TaxID=1519494 RepID=UPI0006AF1621|nr:hypothetical protein [Nocardiopsis sp. NRRL B-16309]KOX07264.1 hypothetical protein ADL05_28810 [Nocardiopsis sp. NRRL B-16309]
MILSILATVAVLAAIATIAAALLLAETTLVYFALGLGGISVLLLLAALVQGGIRAAGQDRTRTGTDGLGKSSVPVTTAVTAPGTHHGPEDSGRAPAPAPEPVRDGVVSEHGSTGFTPVTGDWPETAAGSPDPDPGRPHGHPSADEVRTAPEPEPFDHRIPHQGRTEGHTWAAVPEERDAAPEPESLDAESFSDWTPTRPDEPSAAEGAEGDEERVLPTPPGDGPAVAVPPTEPQDGPADHADEIGAPAEADTFAAFAARARSGAAAPETGEPADDEPGADHGTAGTAPSDHADSAAGETDDADTVEPRDTVRHEEPSAQEDGFEDTEPDDGPTFHYRVPTADASDEAGTAGPVVREESDDASAEDTRAERDELDDAATDDTRAEHGEARTDETGAQARDESDDAGTDDTQAMVRDEPDGAPAPTGTVGADAEPTEHVSESKHASESEHGSGTAGSDGAAEPTDPSDAVAATAADAADSASGDEAPAADAVEPAGSGTDASPAFSYRVPGPADDAAERGGDGDPAAETPADQGPRTPPASPYRIPSTRTRPAEAVGTDDGAERAADGDDAAETPADQGARRPVGSPYRIPGAGTGTKSGPADAADSSEADPDADTTAAFSYRVPDTGTDGAAEPHADGAAAFTYRASSADRDEDPSASYAAIPDPDDEPSSSDEPSRRQDPDQVP